MDQRPETWKPPLVVVIGFGSDRTALSARAEKWIEHAQVLAGGKRLLDAFPEHPGQRIEFHSPIDEAVNRVAVASLHKRVAVLASGDPFFYGIGPRLTQAVGENRMLTLPNITSPQLLFARLGMAWHDIPVHSVHGRNQTGWLRELRIRSKVALFTDKHRTPQWIAEKLIAAGFDNSELVIGEDLGTSSERISRVAVEEVARRTFSDLNVVVVLAAGEGSKSDERSRRVPWFGVPESMFEHQRGMITKLEVRAVVLAHLQLMPDMVLWDLGAASGSVSIEAARTVPLRQVFAVEKEPLRYRQLVKNIRDFRCGEIMPIFAGAMDVVGDLPPPDRVFIGGSGGELANLLEVVSRRLRKGGRVVQTVISLDTLDQVRSFWSSRGWQVSLVQVQINRSVPLGSSNPSLPPAVRLDALNPVFVVSAWESNG